MGWGNFGETRSFPLISCHLSRERCRSWGRNGGGSGGFCGRFLRFWRSGGRIWGDGVWDGSRLLSARGGRITEIRGFSGLRVSIGAIGQLDSKEGMRSGMGKWRIGRPEEVEGAAGFKGRASNCSDFEGWLFARSTRSGIEYGCRLVRGNGATVRGLVARPVVGAVWGRLGFQLVGFRGAGWQ